MVQRIIRIAIWDFSDVDGDRIDIYVNGALHAADQEVRAQKKIIVSEWKATPAASA